MNELLAKLNEKQRLNWLLANQKDKHVLKDREAKIGKVCIPLFQDLLNSTLPSNSERFSTPRVIVAADHDYATMRSDCSATNSEGNVCGVRATTQVTKDESHNWALEDRAINFDRFKNPCDDCSEQCNSSSSRSSQ